MLNWLFGKGNKREDVKLDHIAVDLHSHLIPGIDDGSQTLDESVTMIKKMYELGYRNVITTPHVIWDCYRNTPENILSGLEDLRQATIDAGVSIDIQAAAEYFIDEHFVEMLRTDQRLLTLPGNRLLVELPYSTPLMNTSETLFHIIEKGYQPVLAHPERYTYFYSDPGIYKKLADQGCELQVNALSLGNYYGPNVNKMAEWLLQNKLITFLGTDAHKIQHLEMIKRSDRNGWLSRYAFQNEKLISI